MTNQPLRVGPQMPAIEVPPELREAYANMVRIAHMPSEMVFDFALKLPGSDAAKVTARVMMSPLSAKLFQRALAENLGKYEAMFGEVRIPGEASLAEYSKLFRPPAQPEGETKEGDK